MGQQAKEKKRQSGGRKPKLNPASRFICFRLNEDEQVQLKIKMQRLGITGRTKFIKAAIFGHTVKVVKIDRDMEDYVTRLSEFYNQFQAIGNNYNQTTRAIKANFGEKRGLAMLYKLEKHTIELVMLSHQIAALTKEFEEKYLRKQG